MTKSKDFEFLILEITAGEWEHTKYISMKVRTDSQEYIVVRRLDNNDFVSLFDFVIDKMKEEIKRLINEDKNKNQT